MTEWYCYRRPVGRAVAFRRCRIFSQVDEGLGDRAASEGAVQSDESWLAGPTASRADMRRIRGAAANVGIFANTALVNKADVCVEKSVAERVAKGDVQRCMDEMLERGECGFCLA